MTAERERPVSVPGSLVRCPFCHADVDVDAGGWRACTRCLARHHDACFRDAGRCGGCGHGEAFVQGRREPVRVTASRPRRGPSLLTFLTITVLLGVAVWQLRDLLAVHQELGAARLEAEIAAADAAEARRAQRSAEPRWLPRERCGRWSDALYAVAVDRSGDAAHVSGTWPPTGVPAHIVIALGGAQLGEDEWNVWARGPERRTSRVSLDRGAAEGPWLTIIEAEGPPRHVRITPEAFRSGFEQLSRGDPHDFDLAGLARRLEARAVPR